MHNADRPATRGWAYQSIPELVLSEGVTFTFGHGRTRFRGEMRACYANAFALMCREPDVIYCEGYALSDEVPIPLDHAWCCRPDGKILEPTWRYKNTAYLGIPLKREYVHECFLKRKQGCVLHAWRREWPMLTGEEPKKLWLETLKPVDIDKGKR